MWGGGGEGMNTDYGALCMLVVDSPKSSRSPSAHARCSLTTESSMEADGLLSKALTWRKHEKLRGADAPEIAPSSSCSCTLMIADTASVILERSNCGFFERPCTMSGGILQDGRS